MEKIKDRPRVRGEAKQRKVGAMFKKVKPVRSEAKQREVALFLEGDEFTHIQKWLFFLKAKQREVALFLEGKE